MATTVDTLVVRIEADMKDMRRGLKRLEADVSKSTNKMSSSFKKMGTAMKVGVAAIIVRQGARAGSALISLSSDIEEMQGKSKVVFGNFRKNVVKELTEFGDAVGRSSFELEEMASSVQDTFVPMGFARGEASKLSVELTKLAVDTASFNNASDTQTMEAFKSALVGNHETVRRFGVVITEATLNQELLNMGVQGGAKAATNAQKVQARLNLITSGVADAHNDAARTAGSFANQSKRLMSALKELAAGIMGNVLPMATAIVHALAEGAEAAKEFLIQMGLIDEEPETAVSRRITELKELEEQLEKTTKQLKDYEEKTGKTLTVMPTHPMLGPATISNPDLLLPNFVEDQKKRIEELKKAIHDLRIETGSFPNNPPHIFENPFTQNFPNNAPHIFENPDVAFEDTERGKQTASAKALLELTNRQADLEGALHSARMGNNSKEIRHQRAALIHHRLKQQFDEMAPKNLHDLTMAMVDAEISQENYNELQKQQNDAIQSGTNFVAGMVTEQEKLLQLRRDLTEANSFGAITDTELAEALELLKQKALELDPAFVQMQDRIQTTFDKLSDSLTEMVMNGKINFGTMKDMFKDMVRQMIADALKAQVIKPLIGGLFGGIGTAIGGPIGTAFSAVGAQATGGKAGGGALQSGNPYLVGERGPELIVPSSAGTIMNNHNTKNAMGRGGGTVVNQTINVQSGVAQTVRAEMISLLPRFKQDTMNAVVDAKRRGGAFGQAFG
jgi:hypothetical protein